MENLISEEINFVFGEGEHPRLFFKREDLKYLKEKLNTTEGKKIIDRLKYLLDGKNGETLPEYFVTDRGLINRTTGEIILEINQNDPEKRYKDSKKAEEILKKTVGIYTITHPFGYGFLYHLTGDKKYLQLGIETLKWALEGIRNADPRYSLIEPGGILRAGVSIGWFGAAYDLLYEGLNEDLKKQIVEFIQNYSCFQKGTKPITIDLLAGGKVPGYMPESNHFGLHIGAGLALLAIYKDKYVDNSKVKKILIENKYAIKKQIDAWGEYGWFPEGDGTGSMSAHIIFLPLLQAWKNVTGENFINKKVEWMCLKWFLLTLFDKNKGIVGYPARGGYPHNIWARDGYFISGGGYFSQSLGILPDDKKKVVLWIYNKFVKEVDEKIKAPYDTTNHYPHLAVLSFINWPFNLEPLSPEEIIDKAIYDKKACFFAFRNKWEDINDIIITLQLQNTKGWIRARTDGLLEIWAFGKKQKWSMFRRKLGEKINWWEPYSPSYLKFYDDGSGIVYFPDNSFLIVDFTKESGCDGVIIAKGPGVGLVPIGYEKYELKITEDVRKISFNNEDIYFKFLTNDLKKIPEIKVEENKIIYGEQELLKKEEIWDFKKKKKILREFKNE